MSCPLGPLQRICSWQWTRVKSNTPPRTLKIGWALWLNYTSGKLFRVSTKYIYSKSTRLFLLSSVFRTHPPPRQIIEDYRCLLFSHHNYFLVQEVSSRLLSHYIYFMVNCLQTCILHVKNFQCCFCRVLWPAHTDHTWLDESSSAMASVMLWPLSGTGLQGTNSGYQK